MKLDLKQLAVHLSRLEQEDRIPRDRVNSYLLDKILIPCMNGECIQLQDINFDAFELEEVEDLFTVYSGLERGVHAAQCLRRAAGELAPEAIHTRTFC